MLPVVLSRQSALARPYTTKALRKLRPGLHRTKKEAKKNTHKAQPGQDVLDLRHLNESSFGLFLKATRKIDLAELKMPRIVVAGMVSAGKSSLLEIITKFPIFPRQATDCTKHPVVVKLRQTTDPTANCVTIQHTSLAATPVKVEKDEVCAKLRSIMSGSPQNTVQRDEIIIEIHQVTVQASHCMYGTTVYSKRVLNG